jgi:hypothetical protein
LLRERECEGVKFLVWNSGIILLSCF